MTDDEEKIAWKFAKHIIESLSAQQIALLAGYLTAETLKNLELERHAEKQRQAG